MVKPTTETLSHLLVISQQKHRTWQKKSNNDHLRRMIFLSGIIQQVNKVLKTQRPAKKPAFEIYKDPIE
ncbi:hypothetical protein QR680_009712 [Steinernema hermaphroditum]|uniref:Uncharacterized protein n=1 Tax=Steinernema hermaphroditum TaxID=289476 RepID=A0AA39MAE9_9BILA|nr:hypothetical protein QR680_009712 [Steinernema hermaphroditum]